MKKKILFLFTELAGYVVANMKYLATHYPVELHVVRYPVNSVAPFNFSLDGDLIKYYERENLNRDDLQELVAEISPDIIFCSGWIDKDYNTVCRKIKGKMPVVLMLDNPWRNTLKQNIATLIGPLYLKRHFSHCWVPGIHQETYALKLGFSSKNIQKGVYSCDFEVFHGQYLANHGKKEENFPKKIIFVGRYTKLKGVTELWDAFVRFQQKKPNDWELWCLGKGDLESQFPSHDKIKNIGFVQPSEMSKYIEQCGVFILPSHYEHWGVVVHEFAAAGFPLLCTHSTSAASVFLKDDHNGFLFDPYSSDAMVEVFEKIASLSSAELLIMGDRSAEMAKAITPGTWSATAMKFLNNA